MTQIDSPQFSIARRRPRPWLAPGIAACAHRPPRQSFFHLQARPRHVPRLPRLFCGFKQEAPNARNEFALATPGRQAGTRPHAEQRAWAGRKRSGEGGRPGGS
jgi:hypothetical protein